MQSFDDYIDAIVDPLKITKQKKKETAYEIRDHLEMLALEYNQKGMEKEEAIQTAMKAFGNSTFISYKLNCEMVNYRSLPNFIIGVGVYSILFTLYLLLFRGAAQDTIHMMISWIMSFIYLSPVGYFLPIVFRSLKKIRYIIPVSILSGMLFETLYILMNVKLTESVIAVEQINTIYLTFVTQIMSVAIIGCINGLIGFCLLKAVNKMTILWNDLVCKKPEEKTIR